MAPMVSNTKLTQSELSNLYKDLKAEKKRLMNIRKYIEENAIDYSVGFESNNVIDKKNILKCTMDLMVKIIDNLNVEPEMILVDGNRLFKDKNELLNAMNSHINSNKKNEFSNLFKEEYINEKILTLPIDYYHSNVIARSSKTMNECRNIRSKLKKTGTEG